jgi:hypothetical protein
MWPMRGLMVPTKSRRVKCVEEKFSLMRAPTFTETSIGKQRRTIQSANEDRIIPLSTRTESTCQRLRYRLNRGDPEKAR